MKHSSSAPAKRFFGCLFTLILIVSFCLGSPAPAQAGDNFFQYVGKQIALRFNPPRGPSPNRRSGGFGRGGSCPVNTEDMPLTALAIKPSSDQSQNDSPETRRLYSVGGETTKASPTLWFYVPYTRSTPSEGTAHFMLLDKSQKPVFANPLNLSLPDHPGIISVSLPPQISLKHDEAYFWYFSVICDLDHPSRNPSVNGWIRRVPSKPEEEEGNNLVWYDQLNTLAIARRQLASRIDVQRAWDLFMRDDKSLAKLAQKDIQPCCTAEEQTDDLVKL